MSKLIAIVDDEPDILELISINFQKAGFKTKEFDSGAPLFKFLSTKKPDCIILDLMLPDMDGFEICKLLKKKDETANIPIIMLTARADEMDKIIGLEIGADDYLTKPFSAKELIARVKALIRRSAPKEVSKKVELGGILSIDEEKYEVYVKGEKADLTATEFKILHYLAMHKGVVFSRDKLLDHLWGHEKAVTDRTIDVHIKHLRDKLGKAGDMIKNFRGVGYKLDV